MEINGVSITCFSDMDFALGVLRSDRWEYNLQDLLHLKPGFPVFDCLLMSVFDCLLIVFVDRFRRPDHWPMSRASGLCRDTMISVSGNDGFEETVEQILSYPMRIVKTLSCIESLHVHVHS